MDQLKPSDRKNILWHLPVKEASRLFEPDPEKNGNSITFFGSSPYFLSYGNILIANEFKELAPSGGQTYNFYQKKSCCDLLWVRDI